MLESMSEVQEPITLERVRALEKALQVSLPDDYVQFLLTYNGGAPEPHSFPVEDFPEGDYCELRSFLAIDSDIEALDLEGEFDTMVRTSRVPGNLFPIGFDSSGDLICLSLSGPDQGSVVFWDYLDERPVATYDNVYHVANSFTEFLASLCDYDPLAD